MEWVLFAHIVFGTIWLGGVMYQEALTAGARRLGREEYLRVAVRSHVTNGRIYPAVTILILATAIWMIIANAGIDWGDTWISISFALWLVAVATGIGYFTPKAKQMEQRLADEGPSESLEEFVNKVHTISRIEVVVLLALAFLMVFKPGS